MHKIRRSSNTAIINKEGNSQSRISMESDTSGYSSSISSASSSSKTSVSLSEVQINETQRTVSAFGIYSDHVICLKENDSSDISSQSILVKNSDDLSTPFPTVKIQTARRFFNHFSKLDDSRKISSEPPRRNSLEKVDFPKINDEKITNSIRTRRQSCAELQTTSPIATIDRKIITRRRSVYVSSSQHNFERILTRRQSTCIDTHKIPIRRSRRKSTCTEKIKIVLNTKNAVKKIKSTKKPPQNTIIPTTEEETIEDVWFVSLVTIDRESQMRFLVKWDGHPVSENTYEPLEHIRHCDVLQEYVDRKFNQHQDQIDDIRNKLLSDVQEKYDSYKNRSKACIVRKFCDFDELEFKCSLLAYIFTYGGEVMTAFMKKLRQQNLIYQFYSQWKKEQESNFILLETIMSEENYSFELTAENNIDYEPIPNFKYLTKVKYPLTTYSLGMSLNVGCKCGKTCNKKSNCCPQNLGWNFVYESDGKLSTKDIQMIVECNDFCSCDKDCPNRPKPITVRLVIFKTTDRGWGVKTLDHVPAGRFIVEYTGEFLDKFESRKRAKSYCGAAGTYLFDLDYIDKGKVPFSIDATYKGNIARFINHSCNANLYTWPAITCNQDPRMHKLYYFSQRYIRPGEELTIDYTGGRKKLNDINNEKFVCHCRSSQCRGYIF